MKSFHRFWTRDGSKLNDGFHESSCRASLRGLVRSFLLFLVHSYRVWGTPVFGGACRFEPSCSQYAIEVIKRTHPFQAVFLIVRRIIRCRPGGSWGFDPVPSFSNTCRPQQEMGRQ